MKRQEKIEELSWRLLAKTLSGLGIDRDLICEINRLKKEDMEDV